jgi:hypothetical protein
VRPKKAAPGPKAHPIVRAEAAALTSIETDVNGLNGARARVRCETCHAKVDEGQPARAPADLRAFHQGLTFTHGTLACAACHQTGEPLLLHLATGETLPMTEAMQLCSQCHGPQRRAYDDGSHGGMNGHWDLSRGPRLRNQCVHCHDPHAPQIPKVQPVLPPRDRGLVSHSEESH